MWGELQGIVDSPYYHSAPYTDAFCIRTGSHVFYSGGESVPKYAAGLFFTGYTGCANLGWSILIGSPQSIIIT